MQSGLFSFPPQENIGLFTLKTDFPSTSQEAYLFLYFIFLGGVFCFCKSEEWIALPGARHSVGSRCLEASFYMATTIL